MNKLMKFITNPDKVLITLNLIVIFSIPGAFYLIGGLPLFYVGLGLFSMFSLLFAHMLSQFEDKK